MSDARSFPYYKPRGHRKRFIASQLRKKEDKNWHHFISFSDNLREYRMELNITQEELGRRIGICKTQINKWEGRYTYPNFSALINLIKASGRPFSYWVGLDD